jgi:hypothetical protein
MGARHKGSSPRDLRAQSHIVRLAVLADARSRADWLGCGG